MDLRNHYIDLIIDYIDLKNQLYIHWEHYLVFDYVFNW